MTCVAIAWLLHASVAVNVLVTVYDPNAIAKCRVGLHGHLNHTTIVGGRGCIERMHVTALSRVILGTCVNSGLVVS